MCQILKAFFKKGRLFVLCDKPLNFEERVNTDSNGRVKSSVITSALKVVPSWFVRGSANLLVS